MGSLYACNCQPHLSTRNFLVEDKLSRIHGGSEIVTGDIVLCPSTGEIRVLTLCLTRALVLHHTPSTKRVAVTVTTGTVCMLGALLYRYLEHLQRGGGGGGGGGGVMDIYKTIILTESAEAAVM